jgi:hypothetical protein
MRAYAAGARAGKKLLGKHQEAHHQLFSSQVAWTESHAPMGYGYYVIVTPTRTQANARGCDGDIDCAKAAHKQYVYTQTFSRLSIAQTRKTSSSPHCQNGAFGKWRGPKLVTLLRRLATKTTICYTLTTRTLHANAPCFHLHRHPLRDGNDAARN